MTSFNFSRQRGFSLVEIAVVLAIVGLALGAGLSILNSKLAQAKIDNTKTKTEAVRVALINYVGQNFRMPCPADPLVNRGAANYNVERRNAAPVGGETCIASAALINNIGGTALTGVSRGVVPCITLGLSEEACTDGWGVRLTYFVQNNAIRLTRETVSGMRGTMTVHTIAPPAAAAPAAGLFPTGNQINACNATANDNSCNLAAVAIILSHGANRGGGFVPTSGVVLPQVVGTNISAYEGENTNNNIQFIQNDFVEAGANSFDDILVAVVPRDIVSTLNQTGIVKQPGVFMNERFELVKQALLLHAYANAAPAVTPKTLQLPVEGGGAAPYTFTVGNFPGCVLPTTTQLLPLIASMPALYSAGGIVNDAWGRPIRYIRVNGSGVTQSPACTVPFVMVSYGPDGAPGGGDDDIRYITSTDITGVIVKIGNW